MLSSRNCFNKRHFCKTLKSEVQTPKRKSTPQKRLTRPRNAAAAATVAALLVVTPRFGGSKISNADAGSSDNNKNNNNNSSNNMNSSSNSRNINNNNNNLNYTTGTIYAMRNTRRRCTTTARRRVWRGMAPSGQLLLLTCLAACFLEANSAIGQSLINAAHTTHSPLTTTTTTATTTSAATTTTATTHSISSNDQMATAANATKSTLSTSALSPAAAVTLTSNTTTTNAQPTATTLYPTTTTTTLSFDSATTLSQRATTTTASLTDAEATDRNTINTATALPASAENAITEDSVELESTATQLLQPPSADSLTKGFSIPTFLPPFPAFAMADLPSYTTASTTTTTTTTTARTPPTWLPPPLQIDGASLSADLLQQQQDQLYLAAFQQYASAQPNLTMPATNVTVQMGNHAYMPCHIRRLMNKPVSWVRLRDGHILSVDQTTFIADQRFQSVFQGDNEYTWSLQIKYVQNTDEGWYECQVSTEPKMSAKVYLMVVVPRTELIGDQNRFVKAGSKVALHCIVRGTLDPPTYIIWFRGKTQISDDNKMGWYTQIDRTIFGNAGNNQNTIGSLIIPFVRKKDSGNYTCQPSNSAPVSVDLHVLSGEYSASAIMSAASSHHQLNAHYLCLLLLPLSALLLATRQKT